MKKLIAYKEEYLTLIGDARSESTRVAYKLVFNHAIKCYGDSFMLQKLNYSGVLEFRAYLLKQYESKQTVNKYLSVLRTIYNAYMRTYRVAIYRKFPEIALLAEDPFDKVMFRKSELPVPSNHIFVSENEFRSILSACDALGYEQLYDLLMVYRYLGLRKNEAMTLTSGDIHKDYIHVRSSKTNSERSVPLFNEAAGTLRSRARGCTGRLFDYNSTTLHRHFKAVLKKAGVNQNITLHSLRKTFGSALISKVPLKLISRWLGHSTVTMTEQWYIILMDNDFEKWVNINQNTKEKENERVNSTRNAAEIVRV